MSAGKGLKPYEHFAEHFVKFMIDRTTNFLLVPTNGDQI